MCVFSFNYWSIRTDKKMIKLISLWWYAFRNRKKIEKLRKQTEKLERMVGRVMRSEDLM